MVALSAWAMIAVEDAFRSKNVNYNFLITISLIDTCLLTAFLVRSPCDSRGKADVDIPFADLSVSPSAAIRRLSQAAGRVRLAMPRGRTQLQRWVRHHVSHLPIGL